MGVVSVDVHAVVASWASANATPVWFMKMRSARTVMMSMMMVSTRQRIEDVWSPLGWNMSVRTVVLGGRVRTGKDRRIKE